MPVVLRRCAFRFQWASNSSRNFVDKRARWAWRPRRQGAKCAAEHVGARSPIRSISSFQTTAFVKAREHFLQPGCAFAARNAPAAALMRIELNGPQRTCDDVGVFVEHDQAAGAGHRLRLSPWNRNPAATSHSSAFSTGEDEPPGMTAFNFLPLRMPPQTSSIIRSRLKPSGSS